MQIVVRLLPDSQDAARHSRDGSGDCVASVDGCGVAIVWKLKKRMMFLYR